MKDIELGGAQGKAFTLVQVRTKFITEFKMRQSKQQAMSELRDIH